MNYISAFGCLGLFVATIATFPKWWNGTFFNRSLYEVPPSAWPYGDRMWKGLMRMQVCGAVVLGTVPLALFTQDAESALGEALFGLASLLLFSCVFVGLLLAVWRWPQFLIPPYMREEPTRRKEPAPPS